MVDIKHFFLFILSFIQFQIINIYKYIFFYYIFLFHTFVCTLHFINADIFPIYLFN